MSSPTQRSKKELEAEGWVVGITEHWNSFARIRQDLFGFADLLAMKPGEVPKLVQVTTGDNASKRVTKILASPLAQIALASGFTIEVHGWRKLKSNGNRWTNRVVQVSPEDF